MLTLIIGLSAAVLCTISFIPQVLRIWRTKETKDLSLFTFVVFFCGVLLWMVYGILLNQLPVILANSCTLVLIAVIIALKLRYG